VLPEVLSTVRKNSELGFTLVEVLTTLAILGLVIGPTSAAAITIMRLSSWDTDLNLHLRHVQNAGYQILRDGLMCQTVITNSPNAFVSFVWTDWDGNNFVVDYTLTGNTLQRSVNSSWPSVVAEYINPDPEFTKAEWDSQQGQLIVTITSVGTRMTRIQQVYIIRPRAWVGGS